VSSRRSGGDDVACLIASGGLGQLSAADDPRLVAGALSSSLLAMCVVDGGRRLQFVSGALLRMWGYSEPDQVLGRRFEEFVREGDHAPIWALLELNGEAHGDLPALRADGSVFSVEYMARLVRSSDGEVLYAIATFLDVTEDRRAEEQLRLAQRMEAVGQLAAGVAHDFNNLLMAISSHADLLRMKLAPDAPLGRHIAEIKDATVRAAKLVDKMLAYGKRQIMRPEELDLNTVIRGLEERCRPILGDRVELVLELEDDVGTVRADRRQLELVVMNLVENACDAMPSGGSIRISTAKAGDDNHGAGAARGNAGARCAVVEVRDDGEGMDEYDLAHAFEPFFTTRPPGTGHSGLGLAQVWGTVEQTGGSVNLESSSGEGTTVRVVLPLVAPAVEESDRRLAAADALQTILVVEDDERVRAALRESLDELGYEVLEAGDGDEAVRVADGWTGAIDALVTDLIMPGMPVQEMVAHMRQRRPDLPVLCITAYRGQQGSQAVVGGSRSAVLLKPFSLSDLSRSLRGLIADAGAASPER